MEDRPPEPFLSVVVRTQGRRPRQLAEALDALADQRDDDLEVRLVVHTHGDDVDVDTLHTAVAGPRGRLGDRLHHHVVDGGRRGVPLNAGIAVARGRYVAFLDDDDLVTPHWVAAFRAGADDAPGRLVRARARVRDVRLIVADDGTLDDEPVGPDTSPFPDRFDLLDHLVQNATPICSVAIPLAALQAAAGTGTGTATGPVVDETLDALEDWDLLLRLAPRHGVVDRPEVTSIVRRFVEEGGSRRELGEDRWRTAHAAVMRRVRRSALVLDAQFAPDILDAAAQLAELRRMAADLAPGSGATPVEVVGDTIRRVYAELGAANEATTELHLQRVENQRALQSLWAQLEAARDDAAGLRASSSWRVTAPLRALTDLRRRRAGGAAR